MNQNKKTVRRRVLRGIALNRRPGFHFPGNFLDVSFDHVARDASQLGIDPGPWCVQADGQADLGALAILADLALAACMRAHLSRATRLATVSLNLQFTGAPRRGRLRAEGRFQGFLRGAARRFGMSSVTVTGAEGQVCYGSGTFIALDPPKGVRLHPVPLRSRRSPEPAPIAEADLAPEERRILARADAALAAPGSFIRNFWGGGTRFENGPHVGNRVGHAQGGLLVAMAAAHAALALPAGWQLSGISAVYVSPGEGRTLRAHATIVHQGRLTAVVRTRIAGRRRRIALEVVSTHCAPRARPATAGR